MIISRWMLLRIRIISNKYCWENQTRYFMFSNFFRKLCRLWDNVEKSIRDTNATTGNTIWRIRVTYLIMKSTCAVARAHSHATGNISTHTSTKHVRMRTSREICSVYLFSTATLVSQKRLNVTLYVFHCLNTCPSKNSALKSDKTNKIRRRLCFYQDSTSKVQKWNDA
jgi:hypothetical protein